MKRNSCFVFVAVIHLLVAVGSADEKESKLIDAARRGDLSAEPVQVVTDANDWTRDNGVAAHDTWPSFRGRGARGIAVGQDLPEQWDVTKGEGVRWKTAIPGLANSCPIVWKDKVFVTTAVSSAGNTEVRIGLYGAGDAANDTSEHSWRLYCVDRVTGRVLWHRVADEGVPPIRRHLKSSQANSTPATDGKHVVALFNSGQFSCFDMDGKLLWETNLGVLDSGAFDDADYQWGFGSSPIIYQSTVIVQCDIQQESFIAAFEIESGKEIWRMPRDELPSWGTPTVHETACLPLLITNATNHVRGYDARTGRELWKLAGNAAITVPTPIVGRDLIFVTSGYRPIQPIYAVRLNAAGDITLGEDEDSNEHIEWSTSRGGPYLPTPILYGDYLYTCGNNGVFTCYNAKAGKRMYRRRCGNSTAISFTASPVAADGKIYATAESGVVISINAGPKFEVAGTHTVGEYCLSTPAIAGGLFIVRTQKHLIAIGSETKESSSRP
ncbi:MAG: PQQ-binding-like beta-propeller repeat protein [Pirellulaceae bacterium]|jgi:outer membrane protein assembly factor BamB|nr:PQQ-binding-like beta-propeller repeat protein [Pirellulaceae bacterium]MDP6557284.1 PQQ-binding-like beta-propeller repeat protein [Pirellulaceae bacterium]